MDWKTLFRAGINERIKKIEKDKKTGKFTIITDKRILEVDEQGLGGEDELHQTAKSDKT